jgi:hypothetical protein
MDSFLLVLAVYALAQVVMAGAFLVGVYLVIKLVKWMWIN